MTLDLEWIARKPKRFRLTRSDPIDYSLNRRGVGSTTLSAGGQKGADATGSEQAARLRVEREREREREAGSA